MADEFGAKLVEILRQCFYHYNTPEYIRTTRAYGEIALAHRAGQESKREPLTADGVRFIMFKSGNWNPQGNLSRYRTENTMAEFDFEAIAADLNAAGQESKQEPVATLELDCYDAGIFNDDGGGNVS